MNVFFECIAIFVARLFLRIMYFFPIKQNRLFFSSYNGQAYACNPKFIFESLYEELDKNYEFIWCINNNDQIPVNYIVKKVKYLSIKHFYYELTSKVIVNNVGIEPIFPKRKTQIFINTWHGGGAYKKGSPNARYKRNIRSRMTDYVISSCRVFSEEFSKETVFNIAREKFLPIGLPRNDIFFKCSNHEDIRNKIFDLYHIPADYFIILYAPTFRGYHHNKKIDDSHLIKDMESICDAVEKKFNKRAVLLYRCHMGTSFKLPQAIDVSSYPNMQDLLLTADVFITDYSSCMWDFSFTGRPGFLYTPDLTEYEATTKFHTPISKWPYKYALNMEELCSNISSYDEENARRKIAEHHKLLGSFENGTATKKVCEIIERHLS